MENEMASPANSEFSAAQAEYLNKLFRPYVQGAYVRSGASLGMVFFLPVLLFRENEKTALRRRHICAVCFWELCQGHRILSKRKRGKSNGNIYPMVFRFITSRAL
jgi:hypothetical protein